MRCEACLWTLELDGDSVATTAVEDAKMVSAVAAQEWALGHDDIQCVGRARAQTLGVGLVKVGCSLCLWWSDAVAM